MNWNPLDFVRPYLAAIKLVGLGLLLAALGWQTFHLERLRQWRDSVLTATANALPEGSCKKPPCKVSQKQVVGIIDVFGNSYREAIAAREKARADDAQNVIDTGRKVDTTNQEQIDVQKKRISELTAHYTSLLATERLRRGSSAAIGNSGGRGETGVPSIPASPSRTDGAPEADKLPAFCPAADGWELEDRYEASVYATNYDQLITAIEELAEIDPNGEPPK